MADLCALSFVGIYPNAIADVINTCNSCLDAFSINNNTLADNVQEFLLGCGNWNDITNSIIGGYLHYTKILLEENYPQLEVTYYINGDDSHLYINNHEYFEGDSCEEFIGDTEED